MGNQICCEEQPKKQFSQEITVVHKHENEPAQSSHHEEEPKLATPSVAKEILIVLERERPFQGKLPQNPEVIQYGDDIYEGETDNRGRPQGYGKMYKKNGSLFIGCFENGIANGQGYYIKPDGSYYKGRIVDNIADDDNGEYYSEEFQYKGSVKNNEFHGKARQIGEHHNFVGQYEHNKKKMGVLAWSEGQEKYEYEGPFNTYGEFEAGDYFGEFVNGKKHGFGKFKFQKGISYEGEYIHDVKEGAGKLINSDGSIAYEGTFKNGLPHGQGKSNKDGKLIQTYWKQGIDQRFL